MPRKQTQRVRQYAAPGCCYEKPITIDDDDQVAPKVTKSNPLSNHTASWLGALARGRWEGGVDRPAIKAAQVRGCRKRAVLDVDGDNEEPRNGGVKRLRLSGGESCPTHLTPNTINRPLHQTNHYHLTNTTGEEAEDTLEVLEVDLRTRQRQIDEERAIVRRLQLAEEQSKMRGEEERARAAELRDQQHRSTLQSNLRVMWQDYDRGRKVADERLQTIEREQREETEKQSREAEENRLGELASIEASIKSMWEADDLDARGYPKIRPGQLSAPVKGGSESARKG